MIQYVYDKYGRERAAQVANVITYRPRSALREMAKVVGLSPGHADALTKWIDRWGASSRAGDRGSFESLHDDGARRSRSWRSTSPSRCSTSRATSASTRAGW